jgi:rhodanese-related sulfurtransferase
MRFSLTVLIFLVAAGCARAETVPLGVVFSGEQTTLELTYVNPGKAPMHIDQISPSCDCIEVLQKPDEVQPGASVTIPLVHHASQVGTVDVTVRLLGSLASNIIETYTIAGFVADRSWLLSPQEAQGRGLTLIDTRSPSQFGPLHIAHALNIPAFALRTRNDLLGRKLVLLDDGVAPTDLLAQVAALRSQGFAQVFVLNGGLPAWMRAGGKVEGSSHSVLDVAQISAANFAWASRAAKWRVIAVGDISVPAAEARDVIHLSETDNVELSLVSLSKDTVQGLPPNILIIAPTYGDYAKIEAQLGRAERSPVFYLNGGAPALALFRHEQIEAALRTGQVFKTKVAQNAPVVAGGCSSCRH